MGRQLWGELAAAEPWVPRRCGALAAVGQGAEAGAAGPGPAWGGGVGGPVGLGRPGLAACERAVLRRRRWAELCGEV